MTCCPICGEFLKEEYSDYYNGIMHEYLYVCQSEEHLYSEEYAFGNTQYTIGEKTIMHSYSFDEKQNFIFYGEFDFLVKIEKKRLGLLKED